MLKLVADNSPAAPEAGNRRALLAKIHIARKSLAMNEDDYRALLEQVTGHRSASDCDDRQLREAIAAFEELGFRASTVGSKRRDLGDGLTVRKARAMWISLFQLGAIEDGSDAALETFGKRQLGVERLRWSNEREGFRLIEALKAIAEKHGWDQRVPSRMSAREKIALLKLRLVEAQIAKLATAGIEVTGPIVGDRAGWPEKRMERAAAELGARIRSLPKPH